MFKNIHTRKKLLINMFIAQVGFASISTVAILSDSKMTAILVTNILFALIIAYTNHAAMNRVVGGINKFKIYMEDLMDFVYMRKNRIEKANFTKGDEIGVILREMNDYVDKFDALRKDDMKVLGEVVLILDKVSRGIYKCRIQSDSKNFMIRALKETLNRMLDENEKNMTYLKDTLESYSHDDYRKKIEVSSKLQEDMLAVILSVNKLGDNLSQNARNNLNNGQQLENSASSMASSVSIVAKKATEEANTLRETATSVDEITSITRENDKNATLMADLGSTVKESLEHGRIQASKTANSMDEINDKVNAITDSIEVIDQIAFQTNILSLNAAVEAATAGEAGKGFAVVAGEVRNLASRSAEAANEIKALVLTANEKSGEGKKISSSMIKDYEDLNSHISKTLELISNVSAGSKQQMGAIEQINDTIIEIQKSTQENANEVESVSSMANDVMNVAKNLVDDARSKQF